MSRKLFWLGVLGLVLFELANVWFIMPLPFSQRVRSIEVAYALHRWRWAIRIVLGALAVAGLRDAWRAPRSHRWLVPASLLAVAGVAYVTNEVMAADRIFLAPRTLVLREAGASTVDPARLVVGVEIGGEARAYPVQYIGYHHQVRDTIAGHPVLVTFCTVCRTGRVFDPVVDGKPETFRLVGMDHFNAMLEDGTTGSWWRQANGEAIAGPRAGRTLRELPSAQLTLARWLALHPRSLVMQADPSMATRYASGFDYETGRSRGALTGTDTVSWHEKAWVVGVSLGSAAKAFDWNRLRRERVVNDEVGGTPVVLALAADDVNFFAYRRPDAATRFALRGDSLVAPGRSYALGDAALAPVPASQEFWHSWRTFHPGTATW